jgi:hypothetical protein
MKKNIVIFLETEYLNEAAKVRGISRTWLARLLLEKIIEDRLVSSLIGEDNIVIPIAPHYRRFPLRQGASRDAVKEKVNGRNTISKL